MHGRHRLPRAQHPRPRRPPRGPGRLEVRQLQQNSAGKVCQCSHSGQSLLSLKSMTANKLSFVENLVKPFHLSASVVGFHILKTSEKSCPLLQSGFNPFSSIATSGNISIFISLHNKQSAAILLQMFSVHWRRIGLTGKRKHRGMSIIHQETLTKSSPQPLLSHGEEISVQQKKANSSSIFFSDPTLSFCI